jgi:haloalkane dehalogenase
MTDKNILIAWGMKDIAFRKKELNRWIDSFPEARVIRYSDAGHYLAEEKPDELTKEIGDLVSR